jgi:hypothetical protein
MSSNPTDVESLRSLRTLTATESEVGAKDKISEDKCS